MELNVKRAKVWNVWTRTTKNGNQAATLNVSAYLTKDKETGEPVSSWLQIKCYGEDANVASKIEVGDKGKPTDNTYVSFKIKALKIDNTKTSKGYFYIVDTNSIISSASELEILEAEPRKKGYNNPSKKVEDSDVPF